MKWKMPKSAKRNGMSLPVRGAWIEIPRRRCHTARRESLPVRGAWIEMQRSMSRAILPLRRSPCGERGLKSENVACFSKRGCRSPCGERGLKFMAAARGTDEVKSLPVRGAWIEMRRTSDKA